MLLADCSVISSIVIQYRKNINFVPSIIKTYKIFTQTLFDQDYIFCICDVIYAFKVKQDIGPSVKARN